MALKSAEVAWQANEWAKEIEALHGDDLLQKKVEFDEAESVPDLTLLQSIVLEAALTKEFGFEWPKVLDQYTKKASENA